MWFCALLTTVAGAPVDLSALAPGQRQVFEKVAAEEFCGCQSALTLSGCFEKRPSCELAHDLGRVIWRGVQGTGVTADDLLGYLSERVMGPFCSTPASFAVQGAPSKGTPGAPITIVEFADFRCAHCRMAVPIVKEALRRRKDVRLVFMPFPLQNNPVSLGAAEAALAAGAQGKFWEMHDLLFENQDRGLEAAELRRLAKQLGLDLARFDNDLTSQRFREQVLAFKQQGAAVGIDGTPTFFVNGRRYELDPVLFTFEDRFAMELHRNQGNCQ